MTFGAAVTGTCVLNVTTNGTLMPNAAITRLSSTNPGAVSGIVTALTTGVGFEVQLIDPTGFTTAPAGVPSPSFKSAMIGSGVTNIAQTAAGTARTLNVGLTTMTVDLEAEIGGAAFPNGAYTADVVVRCQ